MPILSNARHEKFAQGLASHLTKSAAYLTISPHASTATCEQAGSRLSRNVKVMARVAELQAPAIKAAEASAAWIIAEAVRVVQEAENPRDRVPALQLLARLHPEFSEKHDVHAEIDEVKRIYLGVRIEDV